MMSAAPATGDFHAFFIGRAIHAPRSRSEDRLQPG
jgi:hypothetical protein